MTRLVGINDLVLQRHLLAEAQLMLKKATEIALAHKTAVKDSKVIQGASGISAAVNQVTPARHQSAKPCYHCGKSNHKTSNCYYKQTIYSRKKNGHLAKVCHNWTTTNPLSTTGKQRQNQSTHFVENTYDTK